MKKILILLFLMNLTILSSVAGNASQRVDKNIELKQLSDKAWLIQTSLACNGHLDCNSLLINDTKDLVLVNTPANDSLTAILLKCLEKKFHRKVTRVIVSHFHDDSSGGLQTTHKQGIASYGLDQTNVLLKPKNKNIDYVFTDSLKITLQTVHLELFYFGAGHSVDNIVTWIPEEQILFGGCLLKSLEATDKGNIKDADLKIWPFTVQKVKNRFPGARIVIPGHMAIGDASLFDYTLKIIALQ